MSKVNSLTAGSPMEQSPRGRLDLDLIAQGKTPSKAGAQPKAQQRLQPIANGEGEVGVRDLQGNTLATTLKERQVLRDGQWRADGFVAENMFAYSSAKGRRAQLDPNGYGYFQALQGKMRLITRPDGSVITDLKQARERTSEMIRYGGLTMTSAAQAQTAQRIKEARRESLQGVMFNDNGSLRRTTLVQWQPVIPLPKKIEKMDAMDRVKYMLKEAIRVAPDNAKKELKALLTPKNLAAMAAFAGAQFVPGLNVVADGIAAVMLGKGVVDIGGKVSAAIYKALTTKQPYELVASGQEFSAAFVRVLGVAAMTGAGVAARGVAGKYSSPQASPASTAQRGPPTLKDPGTPSIEMVKNPATGVYEGRFSR